MLRLSRSAWSELIAHAYRDYPLEACGVLGGTGDDGTTYVPCRNEAHSAKTFEVGIDLMKAERRIEGEGGEILAVVHSHTHTDAYPSPTDVAMSERIPGWRWVLVSLKHDEPVVRSYRIDAGRIEEEPIQLS